MSEQKKTSWMIWGTAVLVAGFVAYPLSLGPMVALSTSSAAESFYSALGPDAEDGAMFALSVVYWPLEQAGDTYPNAIGAPLESYVEWWLPAAARSIVIPPSAPLPAPPIPPDPPAEAL
jgi:hypothetical protein